MDVCLRAELCPLLEGELRSGCEHEHGSGSSAGAELLEALEAALTQLPWAHALKFRRAARVPLLVGRAVAEGDEGEGDGEETRLGVRFDVSAHVHGGEGEHDGARTTQQTASKARRYAAFRPALVLLKELTRQHALSEPYKGAPPATRLKRDICARDR